MTAWRLTFTCRARIEFTQHSRREIHIHPPNRPDDRKLVRKIAKHPRRASPLQQSRQR